MQKKKNNANSAKRPSKFLYTLLAGLVTLYSIFFKKHRLVSKLPKDIKAPFIIVCNHTSFFDFVYVTRAFFPMRVNYVVARKYFHFSGLGPVMRLAHAIPKSLYQADMSTVISMMDILKLGGIIGLFPEGQISIHGVTIDNGETIAKFIKKSGVPVVRVLTGGAYLCNPPWTKTTRKGPIESHVDLVLTREQTQELPEDEIMNIVQESIYINTYEWQEAKGYTYPGKNLAGGLENILYLCPCCKKELTITTHGNEIICEVCGLKAIYGIDGHFEWAGKNYFRHLGDWHLWQLENEKSAVACDVNYTISEPVELAMLRQEGAGVEVVGKGIFTAGRKAYIYTGTLNEQEISLSFPTSSIHYLPFDTGRNFQIYSKNLLYEFRPANPKWCMKIANICEGLYEQRKMSKGNNDITGEIVEAFKG